MTDSGNRYSLRLTDRFIYYDLQKSQLFRQWNEGAIVTDPEVIAFLESKNAPTEKVDESSKPEEHPHVKG